jgi:hypothetical protein
MNFGREVDADGNLIQFPASVCTYTPGSTACAVAGLTGWFCTGIATKRFEGTWEWAIAITAYAANLPAGERESIYSNVVRLQAPTIDPPDPPVLIDVEL